MGFPDSCISSKKKILHVSCGGLGNGGVQAVIMNIVRSLKDEISFDIVLTTNDRRYYDDEFESYGGKIHRILMPANYLSKRFYVGGGPSLYRGLVKLLSENKYDAIHCHNDFLGAFCLKAAKKAGVPIRIMHAHNMYSDVRIWDKIDRWLCKKMINQYATHKIGCSPDACISFYGAVQGGQTVSNPYDEKKFVFCRKIRKESPVFLQIGNFSPKKNQLFSLMVIYEIKKVYPNIKFNIIGFDVGGYLKMMEAKIDELSLRENVVFHSHDADSPSLLAETDYFLFPSKKEGFGIVAIEAQAVGVKVFASDTVPNTTNCGGVEFLPLESGAKAWADAIVKDFEETGGEHIEYDCSEFSLENVMNKYRQIYGEV